MAPKKRKKDDAPDTEKKGKIGSASGDSEINRGERKDDLPKPGELEKKSEDNS